MDNRFLKVEGHENLYRDSLTGAIVNTDKPAPRNFSKQFTNAMNEISELKQEMEEIKTLLRKLLK